MIRIGTRGFLELLRPYTSYRDFFEYFLICFELPRQDIFDSVGGNEIILSVSENQLIECVHAYVWRELSMGNIMTDQEFRRRLLDRLKDFLSSKYRPILKGNLVSLSKHQFSILRRLFPSLGKEIISVFVLAVTRHNSLNRRKIMSSICTDYSLALDISLEDIFSQEDLKVLLNIGLPHAGVKTFTRAELSLLCYLLYQVHSFVLNILSQTDSPQEEVLDDFWGLFQLLKNESSIIENHSWFSILII